MTNPSPSGTLRECWSCGCLEVRSEWQVQERQFGWGNEFTYLECPRCESLRISEVPRDIARYYPDSYFSLRSVNKNPILRSAHRARLRHALISPSRFGALVTKLIGPPQYAGWTSELGITTDSRILDIGAGTGERVIEMIGAGFTAVSGMEPFIDSDIHLQNGGVIFKSTLADLQGEWDLVMSHHSFEHMPDPLLALGNMRRLLRPGGVAMIRIPLAGTYAWRRYRTKSVQFDAPRHLTLHTERSISILAQRVGFSVERVAFDGTAFQFWGSEMYLRDVPLVKAKGFARRHAMAPANQWVMKRYKSRASQLNRSGQGDQAAFYLRKM